ncbi:MAG: hypothetical protein IK048_02820 [Clostridia bacterium]|nr:hypothetical protein [Clostridia bacterium]
MGEKLKWTYDDNLSICKTVLKEYVVYQRDTAINVLAKRIVLSQQFSQTSKMRKIMNIKCLMDEYGVDSSLNCVALDQYSKDNQRAFIKACELLGIKEFPYV